MRLKLLLLSTAFLLSSQYLNAQQSPSLSLSAYAHVLTDDWCGMGSGSVEVQVSGGTPPYNYNWSNGAMSAISTGLSAGQYDVTVTDNLGATATSSAYIFGASNPDFWAISVVMPNHGMNNGSVTSGIYPGNNAMLLPDGNYNFNLYDAGFNLVRSINMFCPGCSDPFQVYDTLSIGHYTLEGGLSGGCYTSIDFDLKELPDVNPSYSTVAACHGSPTGVLAINTHPSPVITSSTFNCNLTSTLGAFGSPVTSQWKCMVFDSGSSLVKRLVTQDSIITVTGLLPGNYHVEIYSGDTIETFNPGNHDSVLVYISNFSIADDTTCSLVYGKVFNDYQHDCIFNYTDFPLPGTLIELNPGNYSAVTNPDGDFFIPVPVGVYTLKQYAPYHYVQQCPDTNTFSITISSTGQSVNVQVADSINTNPDVQIGLAASAARPGFNLHYYIRYENLTPNLIPAQTITFDFDSLLTFISSNVNPTTSSNNQITWNTPSMSAYEIRNFNVVFNVPAITPVGTMLNASASVTAVAGETNTANNSDAVSQTVSSSYDPNLKEVSPVGYGSVGYITNSELLKYTIQFQNTGNDTAFNITVADTLSSALDKYSMQILDASNNYWYEFKNPDVVLFHFDNIMLPDSATNEEASHGFIKFSIAQKPGNPPGTIIHNRADITFDFNTPVATNSVMNTIFDCTQMASANFSNQTICENETIDAYASLLFDMNTDWYLDSVFYSSDSSVLFSNLTVGIHEIKLVASNPTCSQVIVTNISVNALPPQPTFTNTSGTLTSSSATGNQWLLNGAPISGANNMMHVVTQSGWYSVVVTDNNGCSNTSDSAYVLFTSIKSLEQLDVKLFPNPAADEFTVYGLQFTAGDRLTISDAVGQIVYEKNIDFTCSNILCRGLNLASGIYFVNIKTPELNVTLKLKVDSVQ